jgi:hypothetical protein
VALGQSIERVITKTLLGEARDVGLTLAGYNRDLSLTFVRVRACRI